MEEIAETPAVSVPERVLLVKLSSLGDIIHSLPVLTALRQRWPDARLDWLVDDTYRELLEGHPDINEVITFPRQRLRTLKQVLGRPCELHRFLRDIRRQKYDIVIDLQGLFRSAFVAAVAGGRLRVGFARGREMSPLFYHKRVAVPHKGLHAVDCYLLLAEAAGAGPTSPVRFELPVHPEADRRAARLLVDGDAPNIVISPATRWETKCWPIAYHAELADRLVRELQARVYFLGSTVDRPRIETIQTRMSSESTNLVGTSLPDLVALIRRAEVVVAGDSGPMHIASAVGTPVAALFGPTSPAYSGPYGGRSRVLRAGVPCAPCFLKQCAAHDCMKALSVEQVFEAVRELPDER